MTDILDLVLTHHWFDMIANGGKREEYRANTEYYRKRLTKVKEMQRYLRRVDNIQLPYKPYKYVRFHRGYTANTMTWTIASMRFGFGKKEWGAPKEQVHIIALGERISSFTQVTEELQPESNEQQ